MGRRFVKQPNGLFAFFSGVTDSFHSMSMNEAEAVDYAVAIQGFPRAEAREALERAKADKEGRWPEALASIEREHGREERRAAARVGTLPVVACDGCGWITVTALPGLVPAAWSSNGAGTRCELCSWDKKG